MNYIIDGYNLIGHLDHIELSDPNKEEKLIKWIESMNSKKNTYTIVFDGHSDNPYVEKKSMTNGIAITTGHTDSADSFIIHFATKTKHKDALIAITADRDIIQKMKKLHVKTWHPDVFSSYHASQSKSHEKPQTMSSIELDWWLDQFQ